MSEETSVNINVNVDEVMDLHADVFEIEENKMVPQDENALDLDVVLFDNEKKRYDKLKENGQLEIKKRTKDSD